MRSIEMVGGIIWPHSPPILLEQSPFLINDDTRWSNWILHRKRDLSIFRVISHKQHLEYISFLCKIQLGLPVIVMTFGTESTITLTHSEHRRERESLWGEEPRDHRGQQQRAARDCCCCRHAGFGHDHFCDMNYDGPNGEFGVVFIIRYF